MSKIKIGWAEEGIMPEGKKISLAGQFYERISDVVETPLTVTALAIECGGEEVIFCSCDLPSVGKKLINLVREKLSKTDFPTGKLIISAIHTHTSLGYAGRSDASAMKGSPLDALKSLMPKEAKYEKLVSSDDVFQGEEATVFLAERIAKACLDAWNSKTESLYATGFGRAAVGMCRRVCYNDGSAKMWGNTDTANFTELEGGNDSGIELLFTYDTNKKLTGVIANVACPAQVLEHRSFASSDYFGKVKKYLRAEFGDDLFVLGLVSPAGDQCPRDLVRWVEPETPINDPNIERINPTERIADPSMFDIKGCELVGRRIATEIKFALEDVTNYISDTELVHKAFDMDMPLRRVTVEEKDAALEEIKKFVKENSGKFNFRDNAKMHVHSGTIGRYELQQTLDLYPIEVHVLRLGDVAFATNPYELFLDYGNQMRARSKAKQTFLIQLCCGSCGYLPTEKAEKGSHYSAYVSSGLSGHEGGDLLVRKTVSEINDMWK